jgi:GNAT superfamily N-acetyltransferase
MHVGRNLVTCIPVGNGDGGAIFAKLKTFGLPGRYDRNGGAATGCLAQPRGDAERNRHFCGALYRATIHALLAEFGSSESREGMVEDLEMVFEPLPGEALTRFLTDNVINVNIAKTGVSTWHPVGFFLKNARGEWLGGLTGYIWGGWLHVNFLWVTESLHGQGHGSRLMDAAEQLAVKRGALAANLETHSFQAEDFYLKRGYVVFGRLEDYPPGHTKLFLHKRLDVQHS